MSYRKFSDELEAWLTGRQPKTLGRLSEVFGDKGFALAFLLLLAIPALPLPTGGLTHIFEIVAMLLALEVIFGRQTIWLPRRWQNLSLGQLGNQKALPFLLRRIRWLERMTKPRLRRVLAHRVFRQIIGVVILGFTLSAFLAPPFSGLDTLPALGVVVLALGLLLEDAIVLLMGLIIGLSGIGLIIGLGAAAGKLLHFLF